MVLNNENAAPGLDTIISKLGNVESLSYVEAKPEGALSFRVRSNEYFIPVAGTVDVAEEVQKLEEELTYTEGFLKSVQKKFGANPSNAEFFLH